MLPILLRPDACRCLVVGGGEVGSRKAAALRDGGATVRLVCPEPSPVDLTLVGVEWLAESYEPRHLDGCNLVVAAATPEVNRRVVVDARVRGVWVSSATEPEVGDFHLPAVVRRGDFLVAVGTGGAAPALARQVRGLLQSLFDDAYGHWVALLAELRPAVLEQIHDADARRLVFEALCRWEWLDRLRGEDVDAVRHAMLAELRELATRTTRSLG